MRLLPQAWTVAATLIVTAGTAFAQTPSPLEMRELVGVYVDPQHGLGVEEAVRQAVEDEPRLRADRMAIDVAEGRVVQAGLRPDPMVMFERRVEPGGTDRLTGIAVEVPLDLRRRASRVAVAAHDRDAARAEAENRARLLSADVRRQYGVAAAAVRDVATIDALVETMDGQFALVRAAVDVGRTPPIERDILDVERRRLRSRRAIAAGRVDRAFIELRRLLGMAPGDPLRIREPLVSLAARADGARPIAAPPALDRPDAIEAEARLAAADAAITRERRSGAIDARVAAGYMWMDAGFPQRGFDPTGQIERVRGQFQSIVAGVTISLPLFNRNRGEVAAARAAHEAAIAVREAVKLAAAAELAEARTREASARDARAAFDADVLALARRNLAVVAESYALGRATLTDVLAEQQRLLDVEQAYTDTLREAWEAYVDRLRASGEQP